MKQIANFGCGVNSVAGILKYGINSYDEIIFADTGSEKPETYFYLKFLMEEKNWRITIVNDHGNDKNGIPRPNLYDYYFERSTFPRVQFRDCTQKFKVRGIQRYLRKKYGKKETFHSDIFFAREEYHRMKSSDKKYQVLNYPLVDDKISRDDCIKIIEDSGYPLPVKSACFMCPFSSKEQWSELKVKHPDLFQQSLELEKRALYTKDGIRKRKMEPLVKLKGKESKDLFECGCF
tara:strand:- start:24 stop:725 length:702 start_codon:yes stop_codon:yes gene_type:complete